MHSRHAFYQLGFIAPTHGPLAKYVKLRVAHAPRMAGTFSPPPWVSDPDMHHGTYVTHVPWFMPGSLSSGFPSSRWWEKHSRHFLCMRNPQLYVSDKKQIAAKLKSFVVVLNPCRNWILTVIFSSFLSIASCKTLFPKSMHLHLTVLNLHKLMIRPAIECANQYVSEVETIQRSMFHCKRPDKKLGNSIRFSRLLTACQAGLVNHWPGKHARDQSLPVTNIVPKITHRLIMCNNADVYIILRNINIYFFYASK